MSFLKPQAHANNMVDQAAQSADHAIKSTQEATNAAMDNLAATVEQMRFQASPAIARVAEEANALAQRGIDAVRDGSDRVRQQALRVSEGTAGYVRDEPLKSVLMAAAFGAALMGLVSVLSRSRRHD